MSLSHSPYEHRPARIFLVEDNRGDVLLVKEAFRKARIPSDITVAADGKEALRLLEQAGSAAHPFPDIVLLDLNLPGISGREVLGAIKNDDRLRRIPVLILSSSRAEQDVTACYDAHANCYMVKAQSLNELCDMADTLEQFWFQHVVLPKLEARKGDSA